MWIYYFFKAFSRILLNTFQVIHFVNIFKVLYFDGFLNKSFVEVIFENYVFNNHPLQALRFTFAWCLKNNVNIEG